MQHTIEERQVNTIAELIQAVIAFKPTHPVNKVYFRGESEDFKEGALSPGIYRSNEHLANEHLIYREMQRFNDHEFTADKTAFDKFSRGQRYRASTCLQDLNEAVFSELFFAFGNPLELQVDYVCYEAC